MQSPTKSTRTSPPAQSGTPRHAAVSPGHRRAAAQSSAPRVGRARLGPGLGLGLERAALEFPLNHCAGLSKHAKAKEVSKDVNSVDGRSASVPPPERPGPEASSPLSLLEQLSVKLTLLPKVHSGSQERSTRG